jgi:multiple sugar transport system permease protein
MTKRKKKIDWNIAVFLGPYYLLFLIFIVVPVILAMALAFTYFDSIQFPNFVGLRNFIDLFTQDAVFMRHALPNTLRFALIVGPGGYILAFLMAWVLAQIPHKPRTVLALALFSPSLTGSVAMSVVWRVIFSGDEAGYLNSILLRLGMVTEPVQFLQSPDYLMTIMILVTLWGSMGVGFLAMLSGILNINPELYEAAYIDGLRNRVQEILYVTIPSMRPQMLFGAVMAIVGTFQAGSIGVQLSGANPTPQYAGTLIVNHMEDFGFIRFEMGYASAGAVALLVLVYFCAKLVNRLFLDK